MRHTGVATSIPSGVLETVEKQAKGAYTRHGPIAAPVAMRLARSHSQLGCSADHVCSVHVERLYEVQTIRRRGYTRCRRAVIVVHQTREHDSEYCSSAQHCVEHHGGHVAPQVSRDAGLVRAQDRDGPEQVPPAMRNTRSTHLQAQRFRIHAKFSRQNNTIVLGMGAPRGDRRDDHPNEKVTVLVRTTLVDFCDLRDPIAC